MIYKFVIGCGGAAFTIYSNIGSRLPGMGKPTEMKNLEEQMEVLNGKIQDMEVELKAEQKKLTNEEISVEQFDVMERSFDNQRDDWNLEMLDLRKTSDRLRRNTYFQGALIFVTLGGFLAMLLTSGHLFEAGKPNVQTILSAITFGAGWSSILSKYIQESALKDESNEVKLKVADLEKDYNDMVNKYEGIINEKAKEYTEKANEKIVEISNRYNKLVEDQMKTVDEFKKLKEAVKDNPIAVELAKLGFEF
jgi:DnaJ-domain-containing protein 1